MSCDWLVRGHVTRCSPLIGPARCCPASPGSSRGSTPCPSPSTPRTSLQVSCDWLARYHVIIDNDLIGRAFTVSGPLLLAANGFLQSISVFYHPFFVLLQLSQYIDPCALKQQRLCPVNKLTIHSTCSYPPTLTTLLLYTELCKWEQLDFQFIIPRYPL